MHRGFREDGNHKIFEELTRKTFCVILILQKDITKGIKMFNMNDVTAKEAAEALAATMRLLPPLGKEEIESIKKNPTLNWWQKRNLIREIKKDRKWEDTK